MESAALTGWRIGFCREGRIVGTEDCRVVVVEVCRTRGNLKSSSTAGESHANLFENDSCFTSHAHFIAFPVVSIVAHVLNRHVLLPSSGLAGGISDAVSRADC